MTDEDFERFLEMLERSNTQAFRELMERDRGWARARERRVRGGRFAGQGRLGGRGRVGAAEEHGLALPRRQPHSPRDRLQRVREGRGCWRR